MIVLSPGNIVITTDVLGSGGLERFDVPCRIPRPRNETVTITDETRYHLHQRLETVLGPDEAATLMEHLPPVGWADVATKRDLDQFALVSKRERDLATTELRLEIERFRTEIKDEIVSRSVATERNLRGWVLGSQAVMLTVLGLLIQLH